MLERPVGIALTGAILVLDATVGIVRVMLRWR